MTKNSCYSTLFSCLYDEPQPIGSIGRGTHFSVFRSVEWRDVDLKQLAKPQIHDFAVIWDEDHDTRVISVIESIYMAGLLAPVQFIGERKGTLSIVLASRYYYGSSGGVGGVGFANLANEIAGDVEEDPWSLDIGSFDRRDTSARGDQTKLPSIIQDRDEVVFTYLKNINNLWDLGTKVWRP
jgi:hypothetical protein